MKTSTYEEIRQKIKAPITQFAELLGISKQRLWYVLRYSRADTLPVFARALMLLSLEEREDLLARLAKQPSRKRAKK